MRNILQLWHRFYFHRNPILLRCHMIMFFEALIKMCCIRKMQFLHNFGYRSGSLQQESSRFFHTESLTVINWLSADAPLSWGIYRNIPFALRGLIIIVLFYKSAKENNDSSFRWMWLTIVLSFAFYIPVVLLADVIPMIGMLMIPKTCAYVWTVLIGYKAMKK